MMNAGVRRAYFDGQFYDRDKTALLKYLTALVKEELTAERAGDHVRAVILPHAGYCFSARTAVKTLLKAIDGNYSRILILAPSHRVFFRGIALAEFAAFQTPLGDVPVDTDSVLSIAGTGNEYIAYMTEAHEREHSLEVQLPLLQHFFKDFELIPIITGLITEASARQIAIPLKEWWREDILWVVSSDFTHYGSSFNYVPFRRAVRENLRELDLGAIKFIVEEDLHGFCEYLDRTRATICGCGAIEILLAVLELVNIHETNGAELIHYTNSGNMTSDYSQCVSYAGIAFHDNIPEKEE